MCGQMNRCSGSSRCARSRGAFQSRQESGNGFGCCGCSCGCGCGCDNTEATSPTATIDLADYESFILVPTSVFDQGDTDCGCNSVW